MYICMMLLCTFMIYILYSWFLEGCNRSNGILALLSFISFGVAIWLLVWERKTTFDCWSSSLQRNVLVSYVAYLLRDGLNFQMLGFHGISSYKFHTMHVPWSYGTLGSFLVSLVSIFGEASSIGYLVTTWEDDCNKSSAEIIMVVPLWYFIGILINSKFGNLVPSSKNYTEAKRGESLEKVSKIWR